MKLWILSNAGGLHDIYGVFDDEHREQAEQLASWIGGVVRKQSFILNQFDHDSPAEGKRFFRVQMFDNGKLRGPVYTDTVLTRQGKLQRTGWHWDEGTCMEPDPMAGINPPVDRFLQIDLYAADEPDAVRMADEIRKQLLTGQRPTSGPIPSDL